MKQALVFGATGDVGGAASKRLAGAGYRVLAVTRQAQKLRALRAAHGDAIVPVEGDVSSEESAARLLEAAKKEAASVDAVIASIAVPPPYAKRLTDWSADDLAAVIRANLIAHFIAAKTFIPYLAKSGVYVSLGGGMADRVIPNGGYNSMIQAGERMMIRHLAAEHRAAGPAVRELIIAARVKPAGSPPGDPNYNWLDDVEVAAKLQDMIERPETYEDPVFVLRPANAAH
ncbi:MAG: SDR family oxidoreductase [Hyphomonadaceae bacterium]